MSPDVAPPPTGPAGGLDLPVAPAAVGLSEFLAVAFGPTTLAVLHYGSRAQGRVPREDSAYDFFVIVDDNRAAYESLARVVGTAYRPGLATWLGSRLPPNVIRVTQRLPDAARVAKCCVIAAADWQAACSPRAKDHFCHGRLLQVVRLTWVRDDGARAEVTRAIRQVRGHTLAWGRPVLPEVFSAADYLVAILRRSLAGEVRPETGDHARTLAESQLDELGPLYGEWLASLAVAGHLVEAGERRYRLAEPVSPAERGRWNRYFRRSKARTTARLFKHVALFENWLDYVVGKLERSGNAPVELTPRERRWPLVFLWPRFFRFLRTRSQRRQ